MLIVDSQVHVWAADRPDRPWPKAGADGRNATPNRAVPLGYRELIEQMDAAGVHGALLVPPSWEGEYNDLVLEAVAACPGRFGVMGRIAPDDPQGTERIARWKQQAGMYGVRILFEPGSSWPERGADHWLWPAAEAAGVAVTLASRGYFDVIGSIARRYPRLRISLDHLGADWAKRDSEAFASLPDVLRLASFANVAVKASMLPALSSQPYPYRNIESFMRAAYEAFGPSRFFWGSNLTRLTCSYRQSVTLFLQELPWLSGGALESVMGTGLCEWVGWQPAPLESIQ